MTAVNGWGLRACCALLALGLAGTAHAQTAAAPSAPHPMSRPQPAKAAHRIVFQISSNDPAVMNLVMNNAENLAAYYESKGESAQMEFVAYGPGLAMLRNDVSPVKDRLATLTGKNRNLVVSGCGVTMANQSKAESKEVTLVPQARIVPTGIGRIVELEEQGWTYVRP